MKTTAVKDIKKRTLIYTITAAGTVAETVRGEVATGGTTEV